MAIRGTERGEPDGGRRHHHLGGGRQWRRQDLADPRLCRHGGEQKRRIRFDGTDITGWPPHRICDLGLGQVAEGRQIFPSLSVLDNLELGAALPRARKSAKACLDRVFAMFPRLAERKSQRAGTLSGGEQQMLAIGRCLMGLPRLIMFDEPSLGLAPAVVKEMFAIIEGLHKDGMTVLLVEQNVVHSLKIAHHAVLLENGVVAMDGTGAELLADDRVRQAYLGL